MEPEKDILGNDIKKCEICNKQDGLGFRKCLNCGAKIWLCTFCVPVCLKCKCPSNRISKGSRISKPKHKLTTGRIK